jgi:hypothetical protein
MIILKGIGKILLKLLNIPFNFIKGIFYFIGNYAIDTISYKQDKNYMSGYKAKIRQIDRTNTRRHNNLDYIINNTKKDNK